MARQDLACERYRGGEATLREAAALADVSLRTMLSILEERGIRGNVTLEQQRRAIANVLDAVREPS